MIASHPLRIAVIAPSRFPIAEPFTGGLEAHVWLACSTLRARGHHVTLIAATGSDPQVADRLLTMPQLGAAPGGRRDLSEDARLVRAETKAYRTVMAQLARHTGSFDVIHNHSLHATPWARAHRVDTPMVTTLHTPPLPHLVAAYRPAPAHQARFVAVSRHTATAWAECGIPAQVVHNGIDTDRWQAGPGGGPLIWFGRLVPEKGPQLAIDAARLAGFDLQLAGPVVDQRFFDDEIRPRLSPQVRYLGHLDQQELACAVGRSSVALVTPTWDEPYGLVVAEALSCGTPVAAFRRGGIPEIITAASGLLADPGDVPALVAAARRAGSLSRGAARRHAVQRCSVHTMSGAYDDIYHGMQPVERTRVRQSVAADAVSA